MWWECQQLRLCSVNDVVFIVLLEIRENIIYYLIHFGKLTLDMVSVKCVSVKKKEWSN
jgi:hypothetical protein